MTILLRRFHTLKKSKKNVNNIGQKSSEMNAMDQGLNLVYQTVNQATGMDKGNDGKITKSD